MNGWICICRCMKGGVDCPFHFGMMTDPSGPIDPSIDIKAQSRYFLSTTTTPPT